MPYSTRCWPHRKFPSRAWAESRIVLRGDTRKPGGGAGICCETARENKHLIVPAPASCPCSWLDALPLSRSRSLLDRREYLLITHAILKVWCRQLLGINSLDQVQHCVREAVFVADDMSPRPPGCDVGMGWIRNENPPEPAVRSLFGVEFQFIHPLEIKTDAATAAID